MDVKLRRVSHHITSILKKAQRILRILLKITKNNGLNWVMASKKFKWQD